jgi:FkbM family methyltransferase
MDSYFLKPALYFINRYILFRKYLIARSKKYHISLKFRIEDAGGRTIYKRGLYEEELSDYISRELQFDFNDIFLDVGANIGWYSLLLNNITPPDTKIYAFEPDKLNFELLSFNVKKNKADKVTCINKAISDKAETKELFLYPNKNRGRHSLLPINNGEKINVETIQLEKFITDNSIDFKKIKFMKMDIEGYEYIALKGANKLLKHVPYILSEYSPEYMKKGGIEPKSYIDLLYLNFYSPFLIENGKLKEIKTIELLATEKNLDILWIKENYIPKMN